MLNFDPDRHRDALVRFRAALETLHFDSLLRRIGGEDYFRNPNHWLTSEHRRRELERLPRPHQAALLLFAFDSEAKADDLPDVLTEDLLDDLCEMGLLRRSEGTLSMAGYYLFGHFGRIFAANRLTDIYESSDERVYVGSDSLELAYDIPRRRTGTVLDLGCGTGLLGVLAALHADRVVGTDISENSVRVARMNAVLNGVDDKTDFRQGDLFEPVEGERFDLILCNPPYVPIPDEIPFPVYGGGGGEGLRIVRAIIENLETHLTEEGRAILVLESVGDEKEPVLFRWLREYLPDTSLEATGLLSEQVPLGSNFYNFLATLAANYQDRPDARTISTLETRLRDAYAEKDFRYAYRIRLTLRRTSGAPGLETIRLHEAWHHARVPIPMVPLSVAPTSHFQITAGGQPVGFADPIIKTLVESLDGSKSIEQLARDLKDEHPELYADAALDDVILKVAETMTHLGKQGLVT